MTQVLIVDDEEVLARTICQYLQKRQISARYVTSSQAAVNAFKSANPPVISFVDYRIGRENGIDLVNKFRHLDPSANVVVMTGHGDIEVAVSAMKAGASDFLIKPVPLTNIAEVTRIALRAKDSNGETAEPTTGEPILGNSGATVQLRNTIARILQATSNLKSNLPSVLITGESGTGKELVARALHRNGARADKPFIPVNCASLPAELIESELFGHERGAFTDAKSARAGLFEAADGGVIFLDEIGDMPLAAQAKLLRVIEDRTVRRIGSERSRPVDVWIIAATNRHLPDLVAAEQFRGDLMFRLQVLWIEVPPLRERDADILVIANHLLKTFADLYGRPVSTLTPQARALLIENRWPGNVRELRNVIERAVIMADGKPIQIGHIGISKTSNATAEATLPGMEKAMLEKALSQSNGNITRAASILGITRDTMRYRIEKFGLGVK